MSTDQKTKPGWLQRRVRHPMIQSCPFDSESEAESRKVPLPCREELSHMRIHARGLEAIWLPLQEALCVCLEVIRKLLARVSPPPTQCVRPEHRAWVWRHAKLLSGGMPESCSALMSNEMREPREAAASD